MRWSEVFGLVTFGVAGAGSPGPNNTLLLASGVQFGFRRTVPHITGAAAGVGIMVMLVAAGVGAIFDAFPGAELGLKLIGSVYLLYLAFRLASTGPVQGTSVSKPLNAWEALVFQFVNPKAWILAIGVVTAFLPRGLPSLVGGLLVTTLLIFVLVGTFSTWALGGVALSRLLVNERSARVVYFSLAILLVASIAFLWM